MLHKTLVICLLTTMIVVDMASGKQPSCNLETTKPDPKVYKYVYADCIVAQFAGYLTHKSYNMSMPIENGTVNLDESSCDFNEARLIINFSCGNIGLYFKQDSLEQSYLYYISGTLNYVNSTLKFHNDTTIFETPSSHYYKCEAEQTLNLDTVSLTLKNVSIETYRNTSSKDFTKIPHKCCMDLQPVSNMVSIVVGVCLAVLIAIVIIAYFVGRRR